MAEIKFILGRAGSGKTSLCLDLISRRLRASPLEGDSIILIVPEQAAYQMERTLASWRGLNKGFTRAKVLSFRRLVQLIAKETNVFSGKFLLNTSRRVLMSQIITAARNRGELKFWNNCEPTYIADTAIRLIDEITSAGLTLDELKRKYETLVAESKNSKENIPKDFLDKFNDIIILITQYNLAETAGLIEPTKYFSEYHQLIKQANWLKNAILFVDGFSGFTGIEYKILLNLATIAKQCFISLCLDYESLGKEQSLSERNCFWLTEQTYGRLTEIAKKEKIAIGRPIVLKHTERRRFRLSKQLAFTEKHVCKPFAHIFSSKEKSNEYIQETNECDDIEIIEAETPFNELEFVAAKIVELVRDKNYRYRDISVILRSLDVYGSLIQYTFDKYGIPYFIDIRRSISQHPLAKLIISALQAINDNFSSRWIIKYIKTGLADVESSLADKIENYVLAHGIDNEDWHKQWRYKPLWSGREDAEDIEYENLALSDILAELNNARKKILKPLKNMQSAIGFDEEIAKEIDINNVIDAIWNFLTELKISEKLAFLANNQDRTDALSSQIHKQILNVIVELLTQLRITLSTRLLNLDEIIEILQQSFSTQTVGVIPSCLDQVLVGTIERSRHPAVRASFILGYNESHWPATIKEDVILTDKDRKLLDWQDLPLNADIEEHYMREQYLNYIAITRPQEYLWISYAKNDVRGVPLQPSRFLRRLVGNQGINVKRNYNNQLLTAPKFVSSLIAELKDDGKTIIEKNKEILEADAQILNLFEKFSAIAFDKNQPALSKELANKLFSTVYSFSRIETFYKCPFQHFCRYGLKLKEKAIYKLEPVDLGTVRHQVMKEFWETITRKNIPLFEITESLINDIVEHAIDVASKELKNELLLKEARNVFILKQVTEELKSAVTKQLEDLKSGTFKPTEFEYNFNVNVESITITGRIDRIDLCDDGNWILIIDYKSKAHKFHLDDFIAGISLQLAGYLWVSLLLDNFANYRPAGAMIVGLSGDFETSGFLNESAVECIAFAGETNSCTYNIKLKKNGELTENSKKFVFSHNVIEQILKRVSELTKDAAKNIANGKIAIEPYYNGNSSVCPYCTYKTICRFARGINKYRAIRKKDTDKTDNA